MEIDNEIDGKSLSKYIVKDIAFTSSSMLVATGKLSLFTNIENGEVIVGSVSEAENYKEDLFAKRI